jgi:NitT/TauT family transport system ATP-binding protein
MAAVLSLDRIGMAFQGEPVLSETTVQVRPGERLAVRGPSGCGKTTLLRVVAGLQIPTSGRRECAAGRLGYAFQEPRLIPWRTVRQNLEFVRPRRDSTGLLARLELAGTEHLRPGQLSGGMRQRVNLARALVVAPDLLLLDEPLTGLDDRTKATVLGALHDLWTCDRFAMISVVHDGRDAARLADRIITLSHRPAHVLAESVA